LYRHIRTHAGVNCLSLLVSLSLFLDRFDALLLLHSLLRAFLLSPSQQHEITARVKHFLHIRSSLAFSLSLCRTTRKRCRDGPPDMSSSFCHIRAAQLPGLLPGSGDPSDALPTSTSADAPAGLIAHVTMGRAWLRPVGVGCTIGWMPDPAHLMPQ